MLLLGRLKHSLRLLVSAVKRLKNRATSVCWLPLHRRWREDRARGDSWRRLRWVLRRKSDWGVRRGRLWLNSWTANRLTPSWRSLRGRNWWRMGRRGCRRRHRRVVWELGRRWLDLLRRQCRLRLSILPGQPLGPLRLVLLQHVNLPLRLIVVVLLLPNLLDLLRLVSLPQPVDDSGDFFEVFRQVLQRSRWRAPIQFPLPGAPW